MKKLAISKKLSNKLYLNTSIDLIFKNDEIFFEKKRFIELIEDLYKHKEFDLEIIFEKNSEENKFIICKPINDCKCFKKEFKKEKFYLFKVEKKKVGITEIKKEDIKKIMSLTSEIKEKLKIKLLLGELNESRKNK